MTPRAQGKAWADKKVEALEVSAHGPGPYVLPGDVVYLLANEHSRAVRICRQARMLKFHGLRDTDTNEWLDGYDAACHDILTALERGRGGKG